MRFVSLANPADNVSFQEAVERGAPQDGTSVYVPESVPRLDPNDIERLAGADPIEIGTTVLEPYVGDEMSGEELEDIVRDATTFDIPLVDVGDRKVMEVFHGPTMAFKDVGARYFAAFLRRSYQRTGRVATIATMSTGDTAYAIAKALEGVDGVQAVLGYPKGRPSQLQQEQMRRVAPNVHTLEIDGSFDDCIHLVEEAFADEELRDSLNLTSANSINVGRWLPQITFHARIFSELGQETGRRVTPVGNWGNLMAGLLGGEMGIPSGGYVGASGANDPLTRYLRDGHYEPRESVRTPSNAMDVGNPKNGPRFKWLFGGDIERMRAALEAKTISGEQTIRTIQEVYDETGYLLDPHSAVAWAASRPGDIIIATASPKKFAEEIYDSTGIEVDNSADLATLREVPERYTEMDNSPEDYKDFLRGLAPQLARA